MQELDHTSATLAALDTSEGALKDAHTEYGGQRTRIHKSHKLLTRMHRASLLDRLTLYGGAALFAAVVLYIVTKRAAYFVPPGVLRAIPSFSSLVPGNASFVALPFGGVRNATSHGQPPIRRGSASGAGRAPKQAAPGRAGSR